MSIISEARDIRAQFVKLRAMATDEMSLQVPNLYPVWKSNTNYVIDERVLYNEVLYKVLQAHVSQDGWTPDVAAGLFAKILIPDENVIPQWEQPDSTNPYMTSDKVVYNGNTWISIVDNNVWEPGTYGWIEM
jgi:hypothetical protein